MLLFQGQPTVLSPAVRPIERALYKLAKPESEQSALAYTVAMLAFNAGGLILLHALMRLQGALPLNPQGFGPVAPDLAFNTAVSSSPTRTGSPTPARRP